MIKKQPPLASTILCALLLLTYCNMTTEKSQSINDISIWNASLFVKMKNQLGEGAIWNHQTNELWHIDIEGRRFYTTHTSTMITNEYTLNKRIGTIVPTQNHQAILALEDGVYRFDFLDSSQVLISNPLQGIDSIRLNDGKCDPAGRLWVGSMHLSQSKYAASLYRIEANGVVTQMLDSITISNGIVWSVDHKTMYYIDTPDENVKAFDFDLASGTVSNPRVVVEIGGIGYPDGMTIDSEGMLWIALWNGNMVGRWNPVTGKMTGKVNVPAHHITSCAFGGKALDSLFITTAQVDMSVEELEKFPLAGSVFVAVPGVRGVEAAFFETSE